MNAVWVIISLLGYYASIIIAGICYGFKVSALVIIASCCTAIATARLYNDDSLDESDHDTCEGCKHDLGGGCCRINLEVECGKGEHEAWEEK